MMMYVENPGWVQKDLSQNFQNRTSSKKIVFETQDFYFSQKQTNKQTPKLLFTS